MSANSLDGKLSVVVPVVFIIVFAALGQVSAAKAPPRISIETINTVKPPYTITVLLLEDNEEPATGAGGNEVRLYVDGRAVPPDKVTSSQGPGPSKARLVCVWDVSKSIAQARWRKGAEKAIGILDAVADRSDFSLISVGSEVRNVTGVTSDRGLFKSKLSGLTPTDNKTLLNEAIYHAAEQLSMENSARRLLVLFTDGMDDGSYLSPQDCIEKVVRDRIEVIAFDLGEVNGRGSFFLKRIARLAGGLYFNISENVDTEKIIGSIMNRSRDLRVLSFDDPLLRQPGVHEIRVASGLSETEGPGLETREFVFVPPAQSNLTHQVTLGGLVLLCLVGACSILIVYFRRKKSSPAIATGELGSLRKQVKKLQMEMQELEEQLLRYGDVREEKIRTWKDISFNTARRAVTVLKSCWNEREDPLGDLIYKELMSNLRSIGVEEINPHVREDVAEGDRRYWIRRKAGNPPYKISKVIYPGYYFRPWLGKLADPGDDNLLEAAQVEVEGVGPAMQQIVEDKTIRH